MGKALSYEKLCKNWSDPDPKYDYLFDAPLGKYNNRVKTNKSDIGKIMCKEPYAQEMYDKMFNHISDTKPKDLVVNTIHEVIAKSYCASDKLIKCAEVGGEAEIYVPLSEVKGDLREKMSAGEPFKVMVTKTTDGYNYASRKRCEKIINYAQLGDYLKDGTDFDVTITKLIHGGFIATFGGSIECFLPGAHAAANIIYDFESYIGRTIRVCVDNYDPLSGMYVVSHKRYIKKVLPERVSDIEYGKMYKGVLTANPTKFGVFVEFEVDPKYGSIYTGLIKSTSVPQGLSLEQGDEIYFYVSNVVINQRGVKINLVCDEKEIPAENLEWQNYKNTMVGKVWNYVFVNNVLTVLDEKDNSTISISVDGEVYKDQLNKYKKVYIESVNPITKDVSISFAQ